MMVLMVEMMLMMIPMMPGVMAMTMTAIPLPPPLREGNSSADFSLSELFFSLSSFRLVEAAEKYLFEAPDIFRSRVNNTPKGSRRGATGTRAGPTQGPRWAHGRGSPLPLVARLFAPFWLRD